MGKTNVCRGEESSVPAGCRQKNHGQPPKAVKVGSRVRHENLSLETIPAAALSAGSGLSQISPAEPTTGLCPGESSLSMPCFKDLPPDFAVK